MNKIVCPEIKDNVFTMAYIKVNKIAIVNLHLNPYRNNKRIGSTPIVNALVQNYNEFKASGLKMSDWFEVNILIAVKREENFVIRPIKFEYEKVW